MSSYDNSLRKLGIVVYLSWNRPPFWPFTSLKLVLTVSWSWVWKDLEWTRLGKRGRERRSCTEETVQKPKWSAGPPGTLVTRSTWQSDLPWILLLLVFISLESIGNSNSGISSWPMCHPDSWSGASAALSYPLWACLPAILESGCLKVGGGRATAWVGEKLWRGRASGQGSPSEVRGGTVSQSRPGHWPKWRLERGMELGAEPESSPSLGLSLK